MDKKFKYELVYSRGENEMIIFSGISSASIEDIKCDCEAIVSLNMCLVQCIYQPLKVNENVTEKES